MDETLFGNTVVDPMDTLVAELHKTPGWPVDLVRDRALMAELVRQFPALDLIDELGRFRVWLLAKGTGNEVASSGRWGRVRNWCRKAVDDRAGRSRQGARRTRTSTNARPAEAFGESSTSLARW